MNILAISLYFVALANIIVGAYVYLRDKRQILNIVYSLLVFAVAVWSFGVGMFIEQNEIGFVALVWLKIYYVAAAVIALLFYYFCRSLVLSPTTNRITHWFLDALFLLGVISLVLDSRYVISASNWYDVSLNLWLYGVYVVYFLVYVISGFYILIRAYNRLEGYVQRNVMIVMIAVGLAAFFGVIFNLLLPLLSYKYIYLGPYFTLVMNFIIFQSVFNKFNKV